MNRFLSHGHFYTMEGTPKNNPLMGFRMKSTIQLSGDLSGFAIDGNPEATDIGSGFTTELRLFHETSP